MRLRGETRDALLVGRLSNVYLPCCADSTTLTMHDHGKPGKLNPFFLSQIGLNQTEAGDCSCFCLL